MTTHGTVRKMTDGQRGDIVATMAGAIPPDLTFEEAQIIIGNKPFVAEIRAAFASRRLSAVPADEKWFELEVDDDVDPMSVVTTAGYNAKGWEYLGPELLGRRTLWVQLVHLGYVRNLAEARKKVDEMGFRIVEGQAREPFKVRFPKPDDKDPVYFGGSEWQDLSGKAKITYLGVEGRKWDSVFRWSDDVFGDHSRWLVVSKLPSI